MRVKAPGLRVVHEGGGVFAFTRKDRKPINMVTGIVQISPPHSEEVVKIVLWRCASHHISCPPEDDDPDDRCEMKESLVSVSRWMSYVQVADLMTVKVIIVRRPRMKKLADRSMKTVKAFGPGFAFLMLTR